MPRSSPDGPARHTSLALDFQLANQTFLERAANAGASIVQQQETSTRITLAPPLPDAEQAAAHQVRDFRDLKPISPIERKFRHGFWDARRERIRLALEQAGVTRQRRENFSHCGSNAIILRNRTDGALRVQACHCHDRFCLPCQQSRARRLQRALHRRVPLARCLFVVLTASSNDQPLGEQLTALYAAAAKLRAGKWWKARTTGGFQCFECTFNDDTQRWHPHLHLLVHADWLDQEQLSAEWLRCTGTAKVVHVSLVTNTPAGIGECTKYLAQPVHRTIQFVPDRLVELIQALKGRRLCSTFGTWRSDPLLDEEQESDKGDWEPICTLTRLIEKAAAGDTWARHAILFLNSSRSNRTPVRPPPHPDSS